MLKLFIFYEWQWSSREKTYDSVELFRHSVHSWSCSGGTEWCLSGLINNLWYRHRPAESTQTTARLYFVLPWTYSQNEHPLATTNKTCRSRCFILTPERDWRHRLKLRSCFLNVFLYTDLRKWGGDRRHKRIHYDRSLANFANPGVGTKLIACATK